MTKDLIAADKADVAAFKRGELTKSQALRRLDARHETFKASLAAEDRAFKLSHPSVYGSSYAPHGSDFIGSSYSSPTIGGQFGRKYSPSSDFLATSPRPTGSGSNYSSPSSSRSTFGRRPVPLYEDDLTYGKTLGGAYGVQDRRGNATLIDRPLGGGFRTTSSNGYTTTWDQNFGGGYTGRDSRGTTWQTGQTLGGQPQVKGSNGRTYTREQTLGGGYRWVQD